MTRCNRQHGNQMSRLASVRPQIGKTATVILTSKSQLCPRVYPDGRYIMNAGFAVAEKTSLDWARDFD